MNAKNFTARRRKIILFAGQFIVLVVCLWFIDYLYYANIYPDKLVKKTFTSSNCAVVKKQLLEKTNIVRRFRADFLVSYAVGGTPYQTWVSANGLDNAFTTDQASQKDQLSQFEVGQTYPCWYNPDVPQIAVLVLRHDWASTFPLFIPTMIALIMSYYLARNFFLFLMPTTARMRLAKKQQREKKSK